MKIKVMEYNIQSGRNNDVPYVRDYDLALNVIKDQMPDIIGLCEVGKQASHIFPKYDIDCEIVEYYAKELGMYGYFGPSVYFDGEGYGNALLSKFPIKSSKKIVIPDVERTDPTKYYETRSVSVVELDVEGGLTVLVSHFGLADEERKNAIKTVCDILDNINTPVIFMGDLNMGCNDNNLDSIFERLNEVCERNNIPLTIPSDNPKYKIDYIFISKEFKAESVYTLQTRASDHIPYVAELDFIV